MFIPDNGKAYKVYEQKNAIQKDSNLGHYFISSEKFQELKGFEVLPNDIIVSCAGTIGETYIMPSNIRSGIINQALMIIRLHNINITPFYLLYFDFILKNEAGKDGKGTAIKNIPPFDILKNYLIPLPPLEEQDRIIKEVAIWLRLVDFIDGSNEDIFKLSKNIKLKILDLAIQGKLVSQDPNDEPAIELLKRINPNFTPCDNSHYENLPFEIPQSWVWCQFGKYLDVRDGTHDSPKYVEKGYPFVTSKNLNNGKIDFATTKFISEEDHIKFSQRSFVEDGNILFAMIGSIGNPVLVVKDREFSIKNVALFKPYDKRNTYMEYVLYYLLYIQENLKQDAKGGMQPFIPLNYFRNDLFIPIPPLKEQRRIVNTIETIFSHLDTITAEL